MNRINKLLDTPLCTVFQTENKYRAGKPNRFLVVWFQEINKLFEEMAIGKIRYVYAVYLLPEAKAGNHYHPKDKNGRGTKEEIFYCPPGQKINIFLEDPETKRKQTVVLSSRFGDKFTEFVYIKPEIAHTVENKQSFLIKLINKVFKSIGIASVIVFSNIDDHNPDHDIEYKVV